MILSFPFISDKTAAVPNYLRDLEPSHLFTHPLPAG